MSQVWCTLGHVTIGDTVISQGWCTLGKACNNRGYRNESGLVYTREACNNRGYRNESGLVYTRASM